MYLYVPNAAVSRIINDKRNYFYRGCRYLTWPATKQIATQWLHDNNASYAVTLSFSFLYNFKYYSPTRLQHVPVHGYLLPVAMFDESVVE